MRGPFLFKPLNLLRGTYLLLTTPPMREWGVKPIFLKFNPFVVKEFDIVA
jgi:hypothetical protein